MVGWGALCMTHPIPGSCMYVLVGDVPTVYATPMGAGTA